MKQLNDPRLRKSLYAVLVAVGGILVAYGVVDQASANEIIASVVGLVVALGGGVAVANTPSVSTNTDNSPSELPVFDGASSVPEETSSYVGRHRLGG